jgi:hypothetical protein
MVSILINFGRCLLIYYFEEDPLFGLNIYYMDGKFHEELNMGSSFILGGSLIMLLIIEFYFLS